MLPLAIAILVTVLDQATKLAVLEHFDYVGQSRPLVAGFFSLTYVRNTGAAWGIFSGGSFWLSLFSVAMLVVMVVFRRSFLNDTWDHKVALGLMCGGIIGNLFDRLRLGYVVDFLDFYIGNAHWPAFNVADASICIGVGIYMISALWSKKHPLKAEVSSQQPEVS